MCAVIHVFKRMHARYEAGFLSFAKLNIDVRLHKHSTNKEDFSYES